MESPFECGIELPGSLNHGVVMNSDTFLPYSDNSLFPYIVFLVFTTKPISLQADLYSIAALD